MNSDSIQFSQEALVGVKTNSTFASTLPRERDLQALTSVVQDGLSDGPGEGLPWAVLDGVLRLIPSDVAAFDVQDLRGLSILTQQVTFDGGGRDVASASEVDGDARYWTLRDDFLPNAYAARTGDLKRALRWSDFYTSAELKNVPFHTEFRDSRLKYGLFVLLSAEAGRIRRMAFWRFTRDFSERARLTLQVLRPHLYEVYLDAERRRHGVPRLSRREQEVLRLAALGHSNDDIARILVISVSTVRKHMEHIFDRTGVRNRGAAAALALPSTLGLPRISDRDRNMAVY